MIADLPIDRTESGAAAEQIEAQTEILYESELAAVAKEAELPRLVGAGDACNGKTAQFREVSLPPVTFKKFAPSEDRDIALENVAVERIQSPTPRIHRVERRIIIPLPLREFRPPAIRYRVIGGSLPGAIEHGISRPACSPP